MQCARVALGALGEQIEHVLYLCVRRGIYDGIINNRFASIVEARAEAEVRSIPCVEDIAQHEMDR